MTKTKISGIVECAGAAGRDAAGDGPGPAAGSRPQVLRRGGGQRGGSPGRHHGHGHRNHHGSPWTRAKKRLWSRRSVKP